MKKIKCAICKTDNSKLVYRANFTSIDFSQETFSARRIPDKIHYRIVHCNNCGLVYSNPILTPKEIEKLYRQSKYTYGKYESDLNQTYGKYLQFLLTIYPKKQRLLEIGCGNGFFLKEALKLGFNKVWGVEPGKAIVKKADSKIKKQIIVDVFKKGQFKSDYFDVICMFQVLDHLVDPNEALQECFRILKPGGCLLCINHDVDSLSAKILGEKSPIFDIEHIYLYDKNTLSRIMLKNGFKIITVFDVANLYPLSYWLRMLPLFRGIIKLFKSMEKNSIFKKKIWLKAGNIGIIARKK